MKLQDLTVDDCIVSSTPKEWATVQNIFLMNGYKIHAEPYINDTFEEWPVTHLSLTEGNTVRNVDEYWCIELEKMKPIPAAEFIAANVPPEKVGWFAATQHIRDFYIPKIQENMRRYTEKYFRHREKYINPANTRTDFEQLQNEIELAVRKDIHHQAHLFFEPAQLETALASTEFLHLRELLAKRFPLMDSIPITELKDNNGDVHKVKDFVTTYIPPEGSPAVNYGAITRQTDETTDELVDRILEEGDNQPST